MKDRQSRPDLTREREKVQLLTELAVIAQFGLGQQFEVRGERGLALPGRAVDALQLRVLLIPAPVRAGDAGQLEVSEALRSKGRAGRDTGP